MKDQDILDAAANPAPDLAGLARHEDAIQKCYRRNPGSYPLSALVGKLSRRRLGQAHSPNAEARATRKAEQLAAAERERSRVDLTPGAFFSLVEERHPDGCPDCGGVIVGYARREGSGIFHCGHCRYSERIETYGG